jgi:hypothetical protein
MATPLQCLTIRFLATDFNTRTTIVSLNYTLQILHIKSSLLNCTLATNSFLHSLLLLQNWTLSSESESYITTGGQSATLSWNQAPIWSSRVRIYYYCQTIAGMLMWDALSDERTGLSFTTEPRQRSHFRVRVPWDSWQYFTVSDSRLTHPGGPGPRLYIPQATQL